MVRKLCLIIGLVVCGFLASGIARAETFTLNNGQTLVGDAVLDSANDTGLQVKVGDNDYQRVPWGNFSQEKLKEFLKQPKLAAFVEPFIEIDRTDKVKQTEITVKAPPRLAQPARQSLLGAIFGSSLGWFIVLLLYAANVFAGYEVAIFRAQPPAVVAGLAAIPVLGFAVPIIYLCLPTRLQPTEEEPAATPEAGAAPGETPDSPEAVNPMQATGAEHPAGLHLAQTAVEEKKAPEAVIYQRGQFTFNRRFFETKFSSFFGVVRREEDRDLVMVVKSARGEYAAERISRIAANDMHLQVRHGAATQEVMVPFVEIQEVQLKHQPRS